MQLSGLYSKQSKTLNLQSKFERNAEHVICMLILLLFLYLFFQRILFNQHELFDHRWSTADWLISYAGGFVRRGLWGELANYLQSYFSIDPRAFIFKVRAGIYLLICLSFLTIAIYKKIKTYELILALSPWALMFELNDPIAGGRKEILLILIFLLFSIFFIITKKLRTNKSAPPVSHDPIFYFLFVSLPLLTLAHEGLFFFFQFFLLFQIIANEKDNKNYWRFVLPYMFSLMVLVITYFFKGTVEQSHAICQRVITWGLTPSFCEGSIASIGGYEFQIMQQYLRTLFVYLVLVFGPILLYAYSTFAKDERLKVLILCLCSLIPVSALFFMAQDWGRWIHISALLMFITLFVNSPKKTTSRRTINPILFFFIIINPVIYITQWKIPTAASQFYEWVSFTNDLHSWLFALNLWWW